MMIGEACDLAIRGMLSATVVADRPLPEKLAVFRIWVAELPRGPLRDHARYLLDVLVTADRLAHEVDSPD